MTVRWPVNENFPAPSVVAMRASGHDVLSIAESHAGDADINVLALAREQDRWLVTFDRDYGELLFARNHAPPPAVIPLRVPSYRPNEPAQAGWSIYCVNRKAYWENLPCSPARRYVAAPYCNGSEVHSC